MGQNEPEMVLVIEDDEANSDVIAFVLDDAGYQVVRARDGNEGLALAERQLPDLVVLDLKMAGMDGWEFARQFRARHGETVPVIVCTAFSSLTAGNNDLHVDAWVEKPFDLDDLVGKVQRVVRQRGGGKPCQE